MMKSRTIAWLIPILLSVLCPSAHADNAPKQTAPKPKLTVVTAAAHCDWAWGHSRAWHEERYAEIIRQVLLLMRKYPSYTWQLENVNEELDPFLKKARAEWPGMEEELWQRIREGRIEVIVAISNPRITEVYPETFVRNLILGKKYFRARAPGIKQEVYHAVDLMCGHSQIPQILAQADYQYFMFSRPQEGKTVFWRTGLDGTRMLTACQHYGYPGAVVGGLELQSNSADDRLPSEALAKACGTWDPKTKVMATSARYFHELEKSGAAIPELSGVLDSIEVVYLGALHGNRNLFTKNNLNEDRLLMLEKAQVMASRMGVEPEVSMDDLWRDQLTYTGHAILHIWKDDYDKGLEKVEQTREKIERGLAGALSAMSRGIRFQNELGRPVVVYNFHGWPVTGAVEFSFEGDLDGLTLRDARGREVVLELLGKQPDGHHELVFLAENVPACGYKTFYLSRSESSGPARTEVRTGVGPVENEFYRLRMHPETAALEVVDKQRGVKLGAPEIGGLGEVVFYDTEPKLDWTANRPLGKRHEWEVSGQDLQYSQGPVHASLRAKGNFGPHRVSREARLTRGSRRIEYLVEIDAEDGSGVFCMRFPSGLSGRVSAGIPFGVEPRDHLEKEPFRCEYFVTGYPDAYYAHRWSDVSSEKYGYTYVCPPGIHTGYFYREEDRALQFMLLRVRPMPTRSPWHQVHPSIQGKGHHAWRSALLPHDGTWREASSHRHALEQHVPLLAFSPGTGIRRVRLDEPAPSPAGDSLAESASFAEVSPSGVVLSSLRLVASEEKGKSPQWELRLYETLGNATDVVVRLGCPVDRARRTNLLGEPSEDGGKIELAGNEIRFRILPWKIVTLRATPGKNHVDANQ